MRGVLICNHVEWCPLEDAWPGGGNSSASFCKWVPYDF